MNQAAIERPSFEMSLFARRGRAERQVKARGQGNNANKAGGQVNVPKAEKGSTLAAAHFKVVPLTVGHSPEVKIKCKWESLQGGNNGNNRNNNRDNTRHNQQNNQKQGNARAMTTAPVEQGGYAGNKSLYNRCGKHHFGYCKVVCSNCGKPGHMARDCKGKAIATGANARPTMTCYDCGEKGHTRNYCPKKRDPQGEEARGRAYVIRDAEKQQGPNVVTDHKSTTDYWIKNKLNMRQRRWIELLSDYDCEIRYHPENTKCSTYAIKEENVKAENLGRLIKPIFETRSDGIHCFKGAIGYQLLRITGYYDHA
ncbi:putative reverse transcriptase domain-containing protein [Tanacetum coccineum]